MPVALSLTVFVRWGTSEFNCKADGSVLDISIPFLMMVYLKWVVCACVSSLVHD